MVKRRLRWGCVAAIGIFAIALAVYMRWLSRFGGIAGDCNDVRRSVVLSPDHRWEAAVVERDCGATTSVTKHVQVRRVDDQSAVGSIVVLRSPRDPLVSWRDATHLRISTRAADQFSVRDTRYGAITVEYEQVP